jgi:uncharacterized protein (DUF58 family)
MLNKVKTKFLKLPSYLLKLTKKYSNRLVFGQNRSIFKGSGIDFVDIREYVEGDDPRYIDWNATARTNQLLVRTFQEEREIPIYCLIDLDSSIFFGTQEKLKIEVLLELIATIINISKTLSERISSFVSFKDELAFFKPSKDIAQNFKILNFLNNLIIDFRKNKEKYFYAESNIEKLLAVFLQYVKRTSTVFIFSSFTNIKNINSLLKYLITIKKIKNNEVYIFKLSDPSEIYLKAVGTINILDPLSGKIKTVDINNKVAEEFQKKALLKIQQIEQISKKNNINFVNIFTNDNLEQKMIQFIKNKRL